jgi:hypothetical protein
MPTWKGWFSHKNVVEKLVRASLVSNTPEPYAMKVARTVLRGKNSNDILQTLEILLLEIQIKDFETVWLGRQPSKK